MLWRGVQARVLARRGQLDDAEALAREAVSLAEQTDFLVYRGDALVDLAYILQRLRDGRTKPPPLPPRARSSTSKRAISSPPRRSGRTSALLL